MLSWLPWRLEMWAAFCSRPSSLSTLLPQPISFISMASNTICRTPNMYFQHWPLFWAPVFYTQLLFKVISLGTSQKHVKHSLPQKRTWILSAPNKTHIRITLHLTPFLFGEPTIICPAAQQSFKSDSCIFIWPILNNPSAEPVNPISNTETKCKPVHSHWPTRV